MPRAELAQCTHVRVRVYVYVYVLHVRVRVRVGVRVGMSVSRAELSSRYAALCSKASTHYPEKRI